MPSEWLCPACTSPNPEENAKCMTCDGYRRMEHNVATNWLDGPVTKESNTEQPMLFSGSRNGSRVTFGFSDPFPPATPQPHSGMSFSQDMSELPKFGFDDGLNSTREIRSLPNLNDLCPKPIGNGNVYTWGSGECEQIALRSTLLNDAMCRETPHVIKAFSSYNCKAIAAGSLSSYAIVEEEGKNQVYSWGCSDNGALGRPLIKSSINKSEWNQISYDASTITSARVPGRVLGLPDSETYVKIVAGDSFAAVLAESGRVFAWGCYRDYYGALGFYADGVFYDYVERPREICIPGKVLELVSGENHTVALFSDVDGRNKLCVWGSSEFGQCFRQVQMRITPETPDVDPNACKEILKPLVIDIRDMRFEKWDGISDEKQAAFKPVLIHEDLVNNGVITRIFAGKCTTYICASVMNRDHFFSVGRSGYGELGAGVICNFRMNPTQMILPTSIEVNEIIGGDFIGVILTKKQEVYVWGKKILCGLGKCDSSASVTIPVELELLKEKVASIGLGTKTCYAVSHNGRLICWGENDVYQIGDGTESEEVVDPVMLPTHSFDDKVVTMVAGGAQHAISLVCRTSAKRLAETDLHAETPSEPMASPLASVPETHEGDELRASRSSQPKRKMRKTVMGLDVNELNESAGGDSARSRRLTRRRIN